MWLKRLVGVCWMEKDEDKFLVKPVKTTVEINWKTEIERERTACMALLFKYGFCCRLSQTLSFPLYPQSDCYICQQFPEEMPHTHKVLCAACTHMLLQASKLSLSHTHTRTEVLKRNKSWRAGWSPFCFLSKSFIFAPQQACRHHNLPSRYSLAFEKKERLCVFVCYVYLSGPLRGQSVWVPCGLSDSSVTSRRLFKTAWMWL